MHQIHLVILSSVSNKRFCVELRRNKDEDSELFVVEFDTLIDYKSAIKQALRLANKHNAYFADMVNVRSGGTE